MGDIIRFDSGKNRFDFPAFILSKEDYAKIISEINSNYEKYRNKRYCVHCSIGADDLYYLYYFENHGFNNYNIVGKTEL